MVVCPPPPDQWCTPSPSRFALASKLYDRSASWFGSSEYVRLYYGGPTELLTAQLLVALAADLWLLLVPMHTCMPAPSL